MRKTESLYMHGGMNGKEVYGGKAMSITVRKYRGMNPRHKHEYIEQKHMPDIIKIDQLDKTIQSLAARISGLERNYNICINKYAKKLDTLVEFIEKLADRGVITDLEEHLAKQLVRRNQY